MLYRNSLDRQIDFQIGALKWSVPAGGECDIPPNLTYVIKPRGLPLALGGAGGEHVEAEVVKADAPARLLPGVAVGPDPSDEPAPEVEEDDAPAVTAAAERLRSQGAFPRKGKGR